MLYREIIAVCSEIHTKHTNTLYVQNVEFLNVILVVPVHTVTHGLFNYFLKRTKQKFPHCVIFTHAQTHC